MPTDFDLQRRARELEREQQRQAEMRRGAEIVARNVQEQEQKVARNFLSRAFNAEHVEDTADMPGDKVSKYNRDLWARNKNREDFK